MAKREEIAQAIAGYLQAQGWNFAHDAAEGIFSLEAELECRLAAALVIYQVEENGFFCYTTIAENAAPEIRAAVGEYLHRANYGLANGNFEFDYDDGVIQYKTYFDCGEAIPTERQLETGIATGLTMLDRYGNGLFELLYGGNAAKRLIREAEGN